MKRKRIYIYGLSTGILLAAAFPPFPFPLLAFIAFVPLLFALEHTHKQFFLLLYITFFIFHGGTNWWISSWQSQTDPFLFIAGIAVWIIHPLFFLLPIATYIYIKKWIGRDSALWIFPFLWTSFEWLHSIGEVAYPWLSLGYTQVYNFYWVQIADIIGVFGITFVIILTNSIIYKLIIIINDNIHISKKLLPLFKVKYFKPLLLSLILIIIIPLIYGFNIISEYNHTKLLQNERNIKIGLIQLNVNPWQKWESETFGLIKKHQNIQDSLQRAYGHFDLGVWSETAITYYGVDFNQRHNFKSVQDWINSDSTALLTGFADIFVYSDKSQAPITARFWGDSSQVYEAFNSALLLNSSPNDNLNPQIYHKMRLTPFSERIPYAETFKFALSWLEWGVGISSWGKGTDQKNLILQNKKDTVKIGTIICIESIYPLFVRNYILKGAEILVVITNDAWYDHTFGPEQHFCISAMRAIETRRYIARCANSGITGFIKPTGETLKTAPQYASVAIADEIPLLNNKSIYMYMGNFLPIVATVLSLISLFYAVIIKHRKNSI